jgi:hypothetical protein
MRKLAITTASALVALAAGAGAATAETTRLTADDFDLSGDGAPYEAAKLIVDNWLRRENLKTRPEYEIPVYNLKGQLAGYYFIAYSGEGEPPSLEAVVEEYGKSPVLEIMKKHGEPHLYVKYGGLLRTFTVCTRFGRGGPDTGSHAGVPFTLVGKYRTDKIAERVLGTSSFEHKHVDFEGFNGSVYSYGDRTIYIPVFRYLVGDETYYTSLEELYEAEFGARDVPVSEELLELQRIWWREIIEHALDMKYHRP